MPCGATAVMDGGCGESIEIDCEALEVRQRAEAQGTFMRSAQDHARGTPRLQRFLPPRVPQTPAITGLQSQKTEFRNWRREIIAAVTSNTQASPAVMTAQTVWLPMSSRLVSQQPSRKKPVIGLTEQTSSRSPSTFLGWLRRPPPPLPASSLNIGILCIVAASSASKTSIPFDPT